MKEYFIEKNKVLEMLIQGYRLVDFIGIVHRFNKHYGYIEYYHENDATWRTMDESIENFIFNNKKLFIVHHSTVERYRKKVLKEPKELMDRLVNENGSINILELVKSEEEK